MSAIATYIIISWSVCLSVTLMNLAKANGADIFVDHRTLYCTGVYPENRDFDGIVMHPQEIGTKHLCDPIVHIFGS